LAFAAAASSFFFCGELHAISEQATTRLKSRRKIMRIT
jgi:hypothetical protein